MKKVGLGKGFDALIPQHFDSTILLDEAERVQKLQVGELEANPDQPRKHFDQNALDELAASIRQYGIVQPIIAMPKNGGGYYIVAGERRWRAAQLAGLKAVPVIVRTSEELERLEIALVENVQRVDLSPLEQAASILRLHDQFNIDYETIAKRLGKAQTTVSNIIRLLRLPESAQKALHEGRITEGHARAILALKTAEKQEELLSLIEKHHWNVRQAEQFVTAQKAGHKEPEKVQEHLAATTVDTKRLTKYFNSPVSIRRTAKGGKLEIAFKTDDELARIIKAIEK